MCIRDRHAVRPRRVRALRALRHSRSRQHRTSAREYRDSAGPFHGRGALHDTPAGLVGYMPDKSERIDWVFRDLVFLVILSGRGTLAVDDGPEVALRAPCVI